MAPARKAALAEESAEVEVLFANMEKLKNLTKKIQGSLNRLEAGGKNVEDSIGPVYGNTQRLQTTNSNIDRIIDAIDRIREPLDQRDREERIIRSNPQKVGLEDYIASLDRTNQALGDLKQSNLRTNQQAISELKSLLKGGTVQLEDLFRNMLREDARPVEPLQFITKQLPFPLIPQNNLSQLRQINTHIAVAQATQQDTRDFLTAKTYADIRGDYVAGSLRNLAAASVSTARKTTADAIYRQGTNGIGMYATGLEGAFIAEYENISQIFARDDWDKVYVATCQSALNEFARTLRDLNTHIKNNIVTDCFLGYEIVEIVSNLALRLERKSTSELKRPIAEAVKPVRETAKMSLQKLLDDTRNRIQNLVALPGDGGTLPAVTEIMTRLETMTAYITPLTSIMTSLGDGGWSATSPASSVAPSMKSFDVAPDGRNLFSNYAGDMMDVLMSNLESKARALLKARAVQGIFMANNVVVIERMIRNSELQVLLSDSILARLDAWRKKGIGMYLDAWKEPSQYLLDVQYTSRASRTQSGSGFDSAAIIKALSNKDKEGLKDKFRNFNQSFDDLVARHKSYRMEKEVKITVAKDIQQIIEPLYGRFWDRYRDLDKGKGKYVKYDKAQLSQQLQSLA